VFLSKILSTDEVDRDQSFTVVPLHGFDISFSNVRQFCCLMVDDHDILHVCK